MLHTTIPFARGLACVIALISAPLAAQPTTLPARSPFYIMPVIEGLGICLAGQRSAKIRAAISPQSYCGEFKGDVGAMVRHVLDDFETGGPAGQVRVGYTITVQLLALYQHKNGRWTLDTQKLDDQLALIGQIDRPVVVYLASNHFDSQGELSTELAKDPSNLLQLSDGTIPQTSYFGYKVHPFTLLSDETLPVNRYRFEALRHVARKLAQLPAKSRDRIVAVTLAGELHQMFPDFENGMGVFDTARVTDYSPLSIAAFRQWLAGKYQTIASFNERTGFDFPSFDAVPAPGKNIRSDKLGSFAEHYDGFAGGIVPVSGWLWAPDAKIDELALYVDGRPVGKVPRGLNRLDVYRALPEVTTPNVGFRFELAYAYLPPGRHIGQLVARAGSSQYLVSSFDLHVMGRDQTMPRPGRPQTLSPLRPLSELSRQARASLDLPRQQQDVYFNPLARDWDSFRALQVRTMLSKFYTEARSAGIAPDKLYSHQIVPEVNSTWNSQLFAIHGSLGGNPWHDGLNMYGGATDSGWVRDFVAFHKIRDYGVPEFNPQQWKTPGVHLQAMRAQYLGGARFISPYFVSVTSDRMTAQNAVTSMEIRADNKAEGSDAFYRAIREFAAH
ncbi:hypothetical protein [Pseudorhodoferax sp.]|uniref:hypothetical protein n=1 Tax=Pseudorhodoferax sp. TaxID=1993553 RepID=UPI002DD66DEC|nr:hypothetical protein [Pseudorhodoferax sp.]